MIWAFRITNGAVRLCCRICHSVTSTTAEELSTSAFPFQWACSRVPTQHLPSTAAMNRPRRACSADPVVEMVRSFLSKYESKKTSSFNLSDVLFQLIVFSRTSSTLMTTKKIQMRRGEVVGRNPRRYCNRFCLTQSSSLLLRTYVMKCSSPIHQTAEGQQRKSVQIEDSSKIHRGRW